MSVNFTLTSKTRVDQFKDILSLGDVVNYVFDCSPWVDDNAAITAATWTVENVGSVAISNQALSGSNVSANITANQAGTTLVSVLIQTASGLKKKIWLSLRVKDLEYVGDDYGLNED